LRWKHQGNKNGKLKNEHNCIKDKTLLYKNSLKSILFSSLLTLGFLNIATTNEVYAVNRQQEQLKVNINEILQDLMGYGSHTQWLKENISLSTGVYYDTVKESDKEKFITLLRTPKNPLEDKYYTFFKGYKKYKEFKTHDGRVITELTIVPTFFKKLAKLILDKEKTDFTKLSPEKKKELALYIKNNIEYARLINKSFSENTHELAFDIYGQKVIRIGFVKNMGIVFTLDYYVNESFNIPEDIYDNDDDKKFATLKEAIRTAHRMDKRLKKEARRIAAAARKANVKALQQLAQDRKEYYKKNEKQIAKLNKNMEEIFKKFNNNFILTKSAKSANSDTKYRGELRKKLGDFLRNFSKWFVERAACLNTFVDDGAQIVSLLDAPYTELIQELMAKDKSKKLIYKTELKNNLQNGRYTMEFQYFKENMPYINITVDTKKKEIYISLAEREENKNKNFALNDVFELLPNYKIKITKGDLSDCQFTTLIPEKLEEILD